MSSEEAFRNICSVPIRPEWSQDWAFQVPLVEGKVKNATCMKGIFGELLEAWAGEHAKEIPLWEERAYDTLYALTSLLAVLGNGLVVAVVLRNPSMRTSRNVLITNLALSNLLLGAIAYPLLWLPTKSFQSYGRVFCKLVNAVPGFNIYCSALTVSLMAFDRYRTVRSTRVSGGRVGGRAGAAEGRWRALLWAAAIWGASLLLVIPLVLFYDTEHIPAFWDALVVVEGGGRLRETRAFVFSICSFPAGRSAAPVRAARVAAFVSALQLAFLYVVPLLALLVFNYLLNRFLAQHAAQSLVAGAARRQSEDNSEDADHHRPGRGSTERPALATPRPAPTTASRRQSRTSRLLFSMALSFAILWLPFSVMSLLLDVGLSQTPHKVWWNRWDRLAKFISILSVCVNPFLYGYLNTNFNREFRAILRSLPLLGGCLREERGRRGRRLPSNTAAESCPLQSCPGPASPLTPSLHTNGLSHHR